MADVILFDIFGTLVRYDADRTALRYPDSHALLTSWGVALDHDGFVRTWEQASLDLEAGAATSLVELRMADYAAEVARRCDTELDPARCEELGATFAAEWGRHVQPIAGVGALLKDLARTHRLGIVSNTNDTELVPRMLSMHTDGAAGLFEAIVLSVDHGHRKPHPSIYAAALERFGCDPVDAVFVGDSYDADHLGPTEAGMAAFLIDPDHRHPVPDAHRLASILDLPSRL